MPSKPEADGPETRVVLVKPGDVLLVGDVGAMDMDTANALTRFFEQSGIRVAVFAQDIAIDIWHKGEQ